MEQYAASQARNIFFAGNHTVFRVVSPRNVDFIATLLVSCEQATVEDQEPLRAEDFTGGLQRQLSVVSKN